MPKIDRCRICKSRDLYFFLDLGKTPLANSFIKPGEESKEEFTFPLEVCFCKKCGLVQLGIVVPPELMFRNYIYFSSTSTTMREHFALLAQEVLDEYTSDNDLIVEIASNDGVLLKNMLGKNVRPLGVEPATNIAKVAIQSGVNTINEFFNLSLAKKILSEHGKAKVILANNVFAHIPDLLDCVSGMETLLDKNGVIIIECPHLYDLCKNTEFDTIYHEHLSYFSLRPLSYLFSKFGLELFDAKKFHNVHGGTLRLYVQRKSGQNQVNSDHLSNIENEEESLGLYSCEKYDLFAKNVKNLKSELVSFLENLKKSGKSISLYGAPAKGNTLLNYCKIGKNIVDFCVDRSPVKQGLLTPGMHIPIYGTEKLLESRPDYLLILAWNFKDEIISQQAQYAKSGGKFIIPIPKPKIV